MKRTGKEEMGRGGRRGEEEGRRVEEGISKEISAGAPDGGACWG